MKVDPLKTLPSSKCAKVLFSVCVVLAMATWLLNRSIAENRSLRQSERARYYGAEHMLGKFKALQTKNAGLFEDLTWCAISPWHSYMEVSHSLDDGSAYMYHLSSDAPKELSDYAFQDAVRQFSSNAAVIVSTSRIPEQRFEQLRIAVTNVFYRTNVQKTTVAYVFGESQFTQGLDTNALRRMSRIDDRAEWSGLADWLVFSEWPPRGGDSAYNDGSEMISYVYRYPGQWNSYNEEFYDYNRLLAADPSQAETILLANWTKAREDAMSTYLPPSQLRLAGTELSLNVSDLLMLSGPILVFCQCLYLIFRKRETQAITDLPIADRPFVFPQFACPDEPFAVPIPTSFAEFAERAIWLLFLILPTCVLGFGVLTRFDIVTAGETYSNLPWLQSLLLARRADSTSTLLDLVNLACLGFSFWILLEIAHPKLQTSESGTSVFVRPLFRARFILIPITVLFVLAFLFRWNRNFLWKGILPQAGIMVGFLFLLSWCFVAALRRRSVTGALLVAMWFLVILRLAR
jgi:hypothetical protein